MKSPGVPVQQDQNTRPVAESPVSPSLGVLEIEIPSFLPCALFLKRISAIAEDEAGRIELWG